MAVIHLTGPGDPRAAAYRDIPDPQLLRAHGLFIAEGRLIVERVLTLPRFRVRSILLNEAAHSALREMLAPLAADSDIDILIASGDDITAIGGYDFHRGCLALVERPAPLTLDDLHLDRGAGTSTGDSDGGVVLVLEGIGNADNIGGIFRNAAALGARAVVLGPRCCDPLYRKATRTSMGATLIVPYATVAATRPAVPAEAPAPAAPAAHATSVAPSAWRDTLARLRDAFGYRLVALTPHSSAVAIDAFVASLAPAAATINVSPAAVASASAPAPMPPRSPSRLALLVGSEGAGLSDEALAFATDRVLIPMTGRVDSLNVATATGIALHRLSTVR